MNWEAFRINIDNETVTIGNIPIKFSALQEILDKAIKVVLICFVMYIAIKIGNSIINKTVKRQIDSNLRFSMDTKKANTLGELLKSILKYTVYFFGIAGILATIFGNISLTFASVGGVALGFGSQSLVKDLINGISILFEDQYAVGDYVTIGTFSGVVESLGIRTTVLKDFSGDVHIIPNGVISSVTNHSKSDSRFIVDVEIAYEESIDNTIKIISEVCESYSRTNENLTEDPKVLGVTALNASGINIRVVGRAQPLTQTIAERELRREIKLELDKYGIEIPYPKTHIIKDN